MTHVYDEAKQKGFSLDNDIEDTKATVSESSIPMPDFLGGKPTIPNAWKACVDMAKANQVWGKKAIADKAWMAKASEMSKKAAQEYAQTPIQTLAQKKYNYLKMRNEMGEKSSSPAAYGEDIRIWKSMVDNGVHPDLNQEHLSQWKDDASPQNRTEQQKELTSLRKQESALKYAPSYDQAWEKVKGVMTTGMKNKDLYKELASGKIKFTPEEAEGLAKYCAIRAKELTIISKGDDSDARFCVKLSKLFMGMSKGTPEAQQPTPAPEATQAPAAPAKAVNQEWDADNFRDADTAKALGSNYKGISYTPFNKLSKSDQEHASRMFLHKGGGKYAFKDQHYYYPTDQSGNLYKGGQSVRRVLGIPNAKINDDNYMSSLGYQEAEDWKAKTAPKQEPVWNGINKSKKIDGMSPSEYASRWGGGGMGQGAAHFYNYGSDRQVKDAKFYKEFIDGQGGIKDTIKSIRGHLQLNDGVYTRQDMVDFGTLALIVAGEAKKAGYDIDDPKNKGE